MAIELFPGQLFVIRRDEGLVVCLRIGAAEEAQIHDIAYIHGIADAIPVIRPHEVAFAHQLDGIDCVPH